MKVNIYILIAIIFFASTAHVYAYDQCAPNYCPDRFGIGIAVGPTHGAGLTFKYKFSQTFGIQASAMPYYDGDKALFVGGTTFFITIHEKRWAEAYVTAGTSILYYSPGPFKKSEKYFIFGPGIGVMWKFGNGLGASMEFPISFVVGNKGFYVLPIPNISFMYYF